jgi:hypothetical protein
MANSKISALPSASTPLAGTEVLPIVQGGITEQVSVANLTAGRSVDASTVVVSGNNTGITTATPLNVVRLTDTDTTAAAGQPMGRIEWVSSDTGFEGIKGYIQVEATDGSPDGDMYFATQHNTGAGLAKRLKLTYDGDVTALTGNFVVGTSGKGIDFTAGGTANAVAYLNGSKLLASFSSNFKFDGTTLDVGASGVNSRLGVKAAAGGRALLVQRSNGDNYFYTDNDNAVSTGANGADTVLFINKITATSRSINAAGTLNASGADYAEYMTKAGDFVLAKGDVCGVNADGKLTNVFADAVSFLVKSTDPSFVGGDIWGNEDAIGLTVPQQSARIPDETEQRLVSEATLDTKAVYETVIVKAGDSDEEWAAKEAAYAADKAAFNLALEAARQKVDRVAFAGQVPVNITGAVPGQYIVPINDNGAIKPSAVDEPNMTLAMYMKAVGKVIATEPDGRAKIIVKTA